jgi:hypothetical protein
MSFWLSVNKQYEAHHHQQPMNREGDTYTYTVHRYVKIQTPQTHFSRKDPSWAYDYFSLDLELVGKIDVRYASQYYLSLNLELLIEMERRWTKIE